MPCEHAAYFHSLISTTCYFCFGCARPTKYRGASILGNASRRFFTLMSFTILSTTRLAQPGSCMDPTLIFRGYLAFIPCSPRLCLIGLVMKKRAHCSTVCHDCLLFRPHSISAHPSCADADCVPGGPIALPSIPLVRYPPLLTVLMQEQCRYQI
jgi:hypothetical protein